MANERVTRLYLKIFIVIALMVYGAWTVWNWDIPLGLGLKGGSELVYRIKTEGLSDAQRVGITSRTINVIRRRIDPRGNLEIDIRPQSKSRFYIQLPGMGLDESSRIEQLIRKSGKLRFCLVSDDKDYRSQALTSPTVLGYKPFVPSQRDKSGKPMRWRLATFAELQELSAEDRAGWMLVTNPDDAKVTGEYLGNDIRPTNENGSPAVAFSFRGKGALRFEQLTAANAATPTRPGKQLAIILDKDLYSAPVINARIAGRGIISGNFTVKEVEDLCQILRAGKLPADIELLWNNSVGPQYGEDSIRSGIRACITAFIIVIAFMAVYYLLNGLIADFALLLNLLLILTVMSLMRSTLTLPGVAGLVLTLGMAVDANVLINERVREERGKGKTLGLAIRSGYERAFVTILDSNLTTLITALILLGVGTGPVKGFALTLSCGIVISMFTAIWVTRAIVDLLVEKAWVHRLTPPDYLGTTVGKKFIRFTAIRRIAMVISLILIIAGLGLLVHGRDKVFGIDLTSGVRAEIQLRDGLKLATVRKRVAEAFPGKADVQSVWEPGVNTADRLPDRFSIRVRKPDDKQLLEKLRVDIKGMLESANMLSGFDDVAPENVKSTENTHDFNLSLSKAMSEATLRNRLEAIGYGHTTVAGLTQLDPPSSEFVLELGYKKGDDEAKPGYEDQRVTTILSALSALAAPLPNPVTFSALVPVKGGGSEGEKPPMYLPLRLNDRASTVAVKEALLATVFKGEVMEDLRVVGDDREEGHTESILYFNIHGKDETLARIQNADLKDLPIYPFERVDRNAILVRTETAIVESEVLNRLREEGLLGSTVRKVLPRKPGTEFRLSMLPLTDEKAAELIREKLKAQFAEELAADRVIVGFTPMKGVPADVKMKKAELKRAKFFEMTLDPETSLQIVDMRLRAGGFSKALLDKGEASVEKNLLKSSVRIVLMGNAIDIAEQQAKITKAFKDPDPFRSVETIGSAVAGEMRNQAILAIFLSWIAIVFYIWFRFGEVKFGLAAVTALIHDVLLTLGAVGVVNALADTPVGAALGFSDIKINVTMIAAFLTLIGYSINDTIVVFDRIRENMGGAKRRVDPEMVDQSVNQILSRTLLTSVTTFVVLMVLYIIGGPVLHGFAFVMAFGVLVGTYSSIFIASPILIGWEKWIENIRRTFRSVKVKKAS
jgi:SecD/SecF fusion protein